MKRLNGLTAFALLLSTLLLAQFASAPRVQACGGLFCQNTMVDQAAERIIFQVNDDGTINATVNINYTGSADNFAWVVPVPNPPKVDVGDMATIRELDNMTQPSYIPPASPCPMPLMAAQATSAPSGGGVTVFSQGSVGPYNYAVVGSHSAQELVSWLKENQYRVTDDMIPLMQVYSDEKMVFLAMKLQPDKGVQDIAPVKMTYHSSKPMIPLRLTAVAANPNMGVITWIFARSQMEPENYTKLTIKNEEIVFFQFGGNNYQTLVAQESHAHGGHGFVTEFAGRTRNLQARDKTLQALIGQYPYLTRLYTKINPEEMTIDPVFHLNDALPDVSNVHDLSNDTRIWDCKNGSNTSATPVAAALSRATNNGDPLVLAVYVVGLCIAGALGFVGLGLIVSRRRAAS